jgi:protocatechuate 3,4-dioxygenase beta subunit
MFTHSVAPPSSDNLRNRSVPLLFSFFLSLTLAPAAPEVTEGPYYLNNDLVRQDLRENQGGILLKFDIGIMDTSTCKPLPNALVEIWHANATGYYSSVSSACLSSF